jgi:hypothetical protein
MDPRVQAAVDAVLRRDTHSLLVFAPRGGPAGAGALHLGPPAPAAPSAYRGATPQPGAGARPQRPASAPKGGRPGSVRAGLWS